MVAITNRNATELQPLVAELQSAFYAIRDTVDLSTIPPQRMHGGGPWLELVEIEKIPTSLMLRIECAIEALDEFFAQNGVRGINYDEVMYVEFEQAWRFKNLILASNRLNDLSRFNRDNLLIMKAEKELNDSRRGQEKAWGDAKKKTERWSEWQTFVEAEHKKHPYLTWNALSKCAADHFKVTQRIIKKRVKNPKKI
jgi:hypothetical protein